MPKDNTVEVTDLWVRFTPCDPLLVKEDWLVSFRHKEWEELTEEERESATLYSQCMSTLVWRMDIKVKGKKEQIGQVLLLSLEEEEEWHKRIQYGTYYLAGDKAPSYEGFGDGINTIEHLEV